MQVQTLGGPPRYRSELRCAVPVLGHKLTHPPTHPTNLPPTHPLQQSGCEFALRLLVLFLPKLSAGPKDDCADKLLDSPEAAELVMKRCEGCTMKEFKAARAKCKMVGKRSCQHYVTQERYNLQVSFESWVAKVMPAAMRRSAVVAAAAASSNDTAASAGSDDEGGITVSSGGSGDAAGGSGRDAAGSGSGDAASLVNPYGGLFGVIVCLAAVDCQCLPPAHYTASPSDTMQAGAKLDWDANGHAFEEYVQPHLCGLCRHVPDASPHHHHHHCRLAECCGDAARAAAAAPWLRALLATIRANVNEAWWQWLMNPIRVSKRVEVERESNQKLQDTAPCAGASDLPLRGAWVALYTMCFLHDYRRGVVSVDATGKVTGRGATPASDGGGSSSAAGGGGGASGIKRHRLDAGADDTDDLPDCWKRPVRNSYFCAVRAGITALLAWHTRSESTALPLRVRAAGAHPAAADIAAAAALCDDDDVDEYVPPPHSPHSSRAVMSPQH